MGGIIIIELEKIVFSVLITLSIVYICKYILVNSVILPVIGRASLEIYLLHIIILGLFRAIANKFHWSIGIYFMMSFVVGVGLPLIVKKLEEKCKPVLYLFHPSRISYLRDSLVK